MARLFPPLAALTAAWFVGMAVWSYFAISREAGGLTILDARLLGYGLEDARLFLRELSPLGKARYLGPMRVLDSVFPALLALTLIAVAFRVTGRLALAAGATALVAAGLDYAENAAVAGLLRRGADGIDAEAVAIACGLTMAKFALYGAAFGLLAVGHFRGRA